MGVNIAENVNENITANERNRLLSFRESPGYGGQRIRVKIGNDTKNVAHVTYGAGVTHVSIFYVRNKDDYNIVGVGQHSGTKAGKTTYSALWQGKGSGRVTVTVLGTR